MSTNLFPLINWMKYYSINFCPFYLFDPFQSPGEGAGARPRCMWAQAGLQLLKGTIWGFSTLLDGTSAALRKCPGTAYYQNSSQL